MHQTFWAYNWLDLYGIQDLEHARATLSNSSAIDNLQQMASIASKVEKESFSDDNFIVAGRGIDLTGHLDCSASSCRKRQVEELFKKAWHYFDRIVVADAISHEVTAHWHENNELKKEWLLSHLEVLLYLRDIGAQDLVLFKEKPIPCEMHWREHAKEANLLGLLEVTDSLIPGMAQSADIHISEVSNVGASFVFNYPNMEHTVWGEIPLDQFEGRTKAQINYAVTEAVLRRYVAHLTSDIVTSQQLSLPLGANIWLHNKLLRNSSNMVLPSQAAFNLDLPILHGVSIETLIKIRQDEHESFQRFRDALRFAVKEQVKINESIDAIELSKQLRQDTIEPELRRIRDKLHAAEQTLANKASLAVFLGALVTSCGFIAGMPGPASIAAGIGLTATLSAAATSKYFEEEEETSLSNMYFLWQAVKHLSHEL